VGVGVFLQMIGVRRLGQVFVRAIRVPITVSVLEDHPDRCRDALHEAHAQHQHRLQQKL
jgi:hypothetical protein